MKEKKIFGGTFGEGETSKPGLQYGQTNDVATTVSNKSTNSDVSTSRYEQKVIQQLERDFGKGVVRFEPSSSEVKIEIPRPPTIPFLEIYEVYTNASDVKLLLGCPDSYLQPKSDGSYEHFDDVIQLVGEKEPFFAIYEVKALYKKMLESEMRACKGKIENILDVKIHVLPWCLGAQIKYFK